MNLMKKIMKSLFAIVMIAALAACAMGGVENTTVVSTSTKKVQSNNAEIYLNIVIDMGRTALPKIVQEKLETDFAYTLTGSLKSNSEVSIQVMGTSRSRMLRYFTSGALSTCPS